MIESCLLSPCQGAIATGGQKQTLLKGICVPGYVVSHAPPTLVSFHVPNDTKVFYKASETHTKKAGEPSSSLFDRSACLMQNDLLVQHHADVMRGIGAEVNDQGVWQNMQTQLTSSGAVLEAARTRYCEQQCTLQQLEKLVLEVLSSCIHEDDDSSGHGSDALHQAGHTSLVDTCWSLYHHLQVAQAVQRLQLPPVDHITDKPPSVDPAVHGSIQHVLGVTPQELRQQQIPSKKAAQKRHAPLQVELDERCINETQMVKDQAPTSTSSDCEDSDTSAHVHSQVLQKKQEVRDIEAEILRLIQQTMDKGIQHMQQLQQMIEVLTTLVHDCMLDKQQSINEVHAKYLVANISAMHGKVQLVECQFKKETYTKKSLPALSTIHRILQEAEDAAQMETEQASAQLVAYEECGEELKHIAWEYGQVKERQAQVDHDLHRFTELEQEDASLGMMAGFLAL
eukprot:jgi/Chrzof1/6783/Cz19g09090.t1